MYCFTTGKHFEQWHFEHEVIDGACGGKYVCPHCKQERLEVIGYEDTHGPSECKTFTELWGEFEAWVKEELK